MRPIADLVDGITRGQRGQIAQALTLVESSRPDHRERARELLHALAGSGDAIRVGITGVPGAGKSTTINTLGMKLIECGHRVAVLAVDPTSSRTGGSILGDRTRMPELANHDNAFVRPSPAGQELGGVARATREAMLIMEAAGFDVIIVETVGVGQSEVAVAGMVDTFVMLAVAGTGDQLQGIKRGILEMADLIVVNKADGDNEPRARVAARDLAIAMKLISTDKDRRRAPVLTASAQSGAGHDEMWEAVLEHRAWLDEHGGLAAHRLSQQREWLHTLVRTQLIESLADPQLRDVVRRVENNLDGEVTSALEGSAEILRNYAAAVPGFSWARATD